MFRNSKWYGSAIMVLVIAGCGNDQGRTQKTGTATEVVAKAVAQLKPPAGSKIFYFQEKLPAGTTLGPAQSAGSLSQRVKKVTLSASGYLVFVDEKPTYDWMHDAKIVIVDPEDPGNPTILFTDVPASLVTSSIRINRR